ncbi:MAG: N-methyl-L-tryptophan oxidase [Gemmatimonadaceae bacterium]
MTYDAIIVGVGGMGSAAAYHLARRGLRVLALERFPLGHEFGSSHGLTRIIRLAYFEHPSYVPLLRRSFELWRELEHASSSSLLHVTGALDIGPEESEVFEGSLLSCREYGLRHEVLTGTSLHARFTAFEFPAHYRAVLQPDGGFLLSERCIEAHARLATALGAEVRLGEAMIAWEPTSSGVRVRTEAGVYDGAQLVVAAGAWNGALVPELAPFLTPERQVAGWFEPHDPSRFAPRNFPVFNLDVDEGRFYGFPEFGVPGFKIGKWHHLSERVDPDRVDRATHPRDEAALRACVDRYFPAGGGSLLMSKVCMFTNTPDEHFIIDRHPAHSQVLLVSPCSGHGFKFCSVIGEIVADLVEHDSTEHDISLFRLARFSSLR